MSTRYRFFWRLWVCLVLVATVGCTARTGLRICPEDFVNLELELSLLPSDWQLYRDVSPMSLQNAGEVEAYVKDWRSPSCGSYCFAVFQLTASSYQSNRAAAKAFRASVRRLSEHGSAEQEWEDCSSQADQCVLLVNDILMKVFLVSRYGDIVVLAAVVQTSEYRVTNSMELLAAANAHFDQIARGSTPSPSETLTTPTAT